MLRRCEPLYEGDTHDYCGAMFDDLTRLAVCPHNPLAGGVDPLPPVIDATAHEAPCECHEPATGDMAAVWQAIGQVSTQAADAELRARDVQAALLSLAIGVLIGALFDVVTSALQTRNGEQA